MTFQNIRNLFSRYDFTNEKAIDKHDIIGAYSKTGRQVLSEKVLKTLREDLHRKLLYYPEIVGGSNTTHRIIVIYLVIHEVPYAMESFVRRARRGLITVIYPVKDDRAKELAYLDFPATLVNATTPEPSNQIVSKKNGCGTTKG